MPHKGDRDPVRVVPPAATLPDFAFRRNAFPKDSFFVSGTFIRSFEAGLFSPLLLGMIIRFRLKNKVVGKRKILKASNTQVSYDLFTETFDEYVIGAVQFRIRFRPFQGQDPVSKKTIKGVLIKTQAVNGSFGGGLGVRVYTNFKPKVVSEGTVQVYDPDDPKSGIVPVTGKGSSLELEIENIDVDKNFRIERIELRVMDSSEK